jgi:dephospho-CoA kinase
MSLLSVGLTGGIATGKSHCLERFAALGARTIDADLLAREAVALGSPGLDRVVKRFGRGVLQSDGQLDRAALGRIVFGDPEARGDLEAIVHPFVYEGVSHWLDDLQRERDGRIVAIADIPLLFETGREGDFDVVVVVACVRERQLERLLARGLTRTEAEQRIAAQLPLEQKVRSATHVIDTSGTFSDTDAQVGIVWEKLSERAAQRP